MEGRAGSLKAVAARAVCWCALGVPGCAQGVPWMFTALRAPQVLIDWTPHALPNLAGIAVKNGTLKDSISLYLPLINIGFLSLDLIYLPLEQVHYYVLGRYDIFMEIWGLFVEYIKIK